MQKENEKRLIADIHIDIHKRIKIAASWKNMSMKSYILKAIVRALLEDEKHY